MGFLDNFKADVAKMQKEAEEKKAKEKADREERNRLADALCSSQSKHTVANGKMIFDDELQAIGLDLTFSYPGTVIKYSEVLDYEVNQNGSTVSKGSINIARGIGLGLLTGGIGAVVGLATGGKRKTKEVSESIEVVISTTIAAHPTCTITTSGKKLKVGSKQYERDLKDTQDIAAVLDRIIKLNSNGTDTVMQADSLDQISKLKELLDAGAITQEEFDAKKKQLLDL